MLPSQTPCFRTIAVRSWRGRRDQLPPQMLSGADLVLVGEDAEQVVRKVEAAIDNPAMAGAGAVASLAPAVYVVRTRYKELYKRGATKSASAE